MSITQLIDPFYADIKDFTPALSDIKVGQLVWAPVSFFETVPHILDVSRSSPTTHTSADFKIMPANKSTHFRRKDRIPVHTLPLNPHEEFLISRAKRRLCVVGSLKKDMSYSEELRKAFGKGRKHWECENHFLLPVYTVGDEHGLKLPPEFMLRAQAMEYDHFFYLPAYTSASKTNIKEAICRFDRIFPAAIHHQMLDPTDVTLSENALEIFTTQLGRYHGLRLHPDLESNFLAIQQLVHETLVTI
jgi:hypothetical protein